MNRNWMYFFASDIHLGLDRFAKNREKFKSFLATEMNNHDDILWLVGDTLDNYVQSLHGIKKGPDGEIIQLLQEKHLFIQPGNHDIDVAVLKTAFPKAVIYPGVIRFGEWTVLHGYQLDPNLKWAPERWLSSELDYLITRMEIDALNRIRNTLQDHTDNEEFKEKLKGKGKFIMGHTHVQEQLDWYINTSSWVGNTPSFVAWDNTGPHTVFWK